MLTCHKILSIDDILDISYGGFYEVWSGGEPFDATEAIKDLGQRWEVPRYVIKEHASMGAVHTPIECMAKVCQAITCLYVESESVSSDRQLMAREPRLKDVATIQNIHIRLDHVGYAHGCFKLAQGPLASTAAQMSVGFGVATQLLDGQVFVPQFTSPKMNRPDLRKMVDDRVTYEHAEEFDQPGHFFETEIIVTFDDGQKVSQTLDMARSISPGLDNAAIA